MAEKVQPSTGYGLYTGKAWRLGSRAATSLPTGGIAALIDGAPGVLTQESKT